MSKQVAIIGAGPGGLAAALLLRHAGLEVTIIERMDRVGGRTSAIEENGFRFDRGPTFFLYPRILEEIFRTLGRDLYQEVPMTRLDPQYRLIFGQDGVLDATSDVGQMQEQIAQFCPEDAARLPAFLKENRLKLDSFAPILESEFGSWTKLFSKEMLKLLPLVRPWRSLDTDLQSFFQDQRIRLAFSFQSKYLGMSPYQCPSLFTILSYLEYDHGVFHPIGGCSTVSERMGEIAEEMGVRICLEEEVQEVLFSGKRAVGLVTDKERHCFDALVVNADFARAMTRLVPEDVRPRWNDHKIATRKYSCSTFMLYIGVKGKVDAAHHNIYFSNDYVRNIQDIADNYTLPQDPSFYLENPSVTDSTMAPEGMSSLYLLVPVSHMHERINWEQEKMTFREVAYQQLERIGLGDVKERVVSEKIFTPADWENQMEIYRGATFSMAHNLLQMLHFRPNNRFKELEGVYLVGGGTHPGSGLPVIYSSARISSGLICEDFGLQTNLTPAFANH
ncbi:MAG: phytoene desaturase family protein [Vulcanimicrobiota bacterium]